MTAPPVRSYAAITEPLAACNRARANVAKTTLYRRWPSKERLALAVLGETARDQVPIPDLGDTRAELVHALSDTAATMQHTIAGRTIRGLVPALGDDPALAAEFHATLVTLCRRELARVVERGLARGDFDSDAPLDLLAELLIGPLFWRLLLTGDPLDDRFAERLVDGVLAGLGATPAVQSHGRTLPNPDQFAVVARPRLPAVEVRDWGHTENRAPSGRRRAYLAGKRRGARAPVPSSP
jgi:AcrR family transcriptional regulator